MEKLYESAKNVVLKNFNNDVQKQIENETVTTNLENVVHSHLNEDSTNASRIESEILRVMDADFSDLMSSHPSSHDQLPAEIPSAYETISTDSHSVIKKPGVSTEDSKDALEVEHRLLAKKMNFQLICESSTTYHLKMKWQQKTTKQQLQTL